MTLIGKMFLTLITVFVMIWLANAILASYEILFMLIAKTSMTKKIKKLNKKVRLIDKHAKETLRCFEKKNNFVGVAKTGELSQEISGIMDYIKEEFEYYANSGEKKEEK